MRAIRLESMLDSHVAIRWDEITEEEWIAYETLRVERNKLSNDKTNDNRGQSAKLKALPRTS